MASESPPSSISETSAIIHFARTIFSSEPNHLSNIMSTRFQVIIVGGGVGGLTLANALEKAEVDYVLLESKDEVAPTVGASIAMAPNGSRVLDQLGGCKFPSKFGQTHDASTQLASS